MGHTTNVTGSQHSGKTSPQIWTAIQRQIALNIHQRGPANIEELTDRISGGYQRASVKMRIERTLETMLPAFLKHGDENRYLLTDRSLEIVLNIQAAAVQMSVTR